MSDIVVIEPTRPTLVQPIYLPTVHAQARFLGYLDVLREHPDETFWLCASAREGAERSKDPVADAASLILPITLDTYSAVIHTLYERLKAWDERGVGRLSLPDALYRERPAEGTAKTGSYQRNGGVSPSTFRVLWADIDVDSGHSTPSNAAHPLPTPAEGRAIAEAIAEGLGGARGIVHDDAPVYLVESGSGSFQVYARVAHEVTDEDFRSFLLGVEERFSRHIDRAVVGRHGPIRVWGHNRLGKAPVRVIGLGAALNPEAEPPVVALAAQPTEGVEWAERWQTRLTAEQEKRAARAAATTTARERVDVEAEGDSPRTRMNKAVPASAYVEAVHGGAVEGDRIRLRSDADITVFTHEDGTEFVSTFSPTTMATLGLEPGDSGAASATTYGLLAAVVGKDSAWRVACAFDGRFDGLLPWVAEHLGDLAGAAAALPAPKGSPAATKKRIKNADLVAAFDAAFTVTEVGGDPRKHRRASQVVRYRARRLEADPLEVMSDLLAERARKSGGKRARGE